MTLRGFLGWYLGAVVAAGTAGASAYWALPHQRGATGQGAVMAAATPSPPAPNPVAETPSPAPAPDAAAPMELPKLRPHLAAAPKPAVRHRPHTVVASHAPAHRPTAVASTRARAPVNQPPAYAPPPRQPESDYAAMGYYPYSGYFAYYPGYGYYRSF